MSINDFGRTSLITWTAEDLRKEREAEKEIQMEETQKRSDKDYRQQITRQQAGEATSLVRDWLFHRLNDKGFGAWLSRHEILGFLTEEYHESVEAVHSKSTHDLKAELIDMAVGCIFGIACIDANVLDW